MVLLQAWARGGDEGQEEALVGVTTEMEAQKGRRSSDGRPLTAAPRSASSRPSCSPATPAWVLRLGPPCCGTDQDGGFTDTTVVNVAIANLDDSADVVITQAQSTERARHKVPDAVHVWSTTS